MRLLQAGIGKVLPDPCEADGKGYKCFLWAALALSLLKHFWKHFIRFREITVCFSSASKVQTGIVDACSLLFSHLKISLEEA